MLNLIRLISHNDSDIAKTTARRCSDEATKNRIGFNCTKLLRSVAARRAALFVASSLTLLAEGEYVLHDMLNLTLAYCPKI